MDPHQVILGKPLRAIAMLWTAWAATAHAAHPLITEDTGTQGTGNWQLEVNAEWARERGGHERIRAFQPTATLAYGFIDTADVQLTMPWLREESAANTRRGLLDAAIEVKWRVLESGPWSLGLMPSLTLPTGREAVGLGSGRVGWGSLLILSYDDERWAFHSHAGYRRNRNTLGERMSLRHISASIWLKPTQATKVVFDRSHDTDPDPATSATIRQTIVGIIHSIGSDLDLDAGIRQSRVDRALLVGATLRW